MDDRESYPRPIFIRQPSRLPWVLLIAVIVFVGWYVFDDRRDDGPEGPGTVATERTQPDPTESVVAQLDEDVDAALDEDVDAAAEEEVADEPCRALTGDGYVIDGRSTISSEEGGYLHVSVWTRQTSADARPESEVLLPAGSYSVEAGTNGRVWELVGCTRAEAEADVEAHINRRDQSNGWGGDDYFTRRA